MLDEPIDCDYNLHPVCPTCGHEDRDAWEIDLGTNESVDTECGVCVISPTGSSNTLTFGIQPHVMNHE